MIVYVACPIDSDNIPRATLDIVVDHVIVSGHFAFVPADAWKQPEDEEGSGVNRINIKRVWEVNRGVVEHSHALIAINPHRSYGVAREVGIALGMMPPRSVDVMAIITDGYVTPLLEADGVTVVDVNKDILHDSAIIIGEAMELFLTRVSQSANQRTK